MELLTRRSIIRSAVMLPIGLAILEGCSQAEIAEWVAGEQAISQEFTVVEPELVALGLSASAGSAVLAIAKDVQNVTAAISAASAVSVGQSTLIEIEAYVNAVTPIIWSLVQPLITAANPGIGLTIGLIVAAIPALEAALNFGVDFVTTLTAQTQQLAALAPKAPASMSLVGTSLTPSQLALQQLIQRAGK